jgi:hypothetical protein
MIGLGNNFEVQDYGKSLQVLSLRGRCAGLTVQMRRSEVHLDNFGW